MVKRTYSKILVFLFAITLMIAATPISAFADDDSKIGRISIYKPNVSVEIYDAKKQILRRLYCYTG